MKLLSYTLSYLTLLFIASTSIAQTQSEPNWLSFIEQDLNAQSELNWVENNGSIISDEAWLSFQSNERLEQPILSGTTNAHYLVIGSEQEESLSGKPIRISVSAKQPTENAATAFAIAYSTNDTGNSSWRSFRTTDDWQDYTFTFTVPKLKEGNNDYLGIAGDFYGTNKATLIRNLKMEVQELPEDELQESYVVQSGDSLSKISQTVYGDGTLWADIYEANKDVIENPNFVVVGTELIIPNR